MGKKGWESRRSRHVSTFIGGAIVGSLAFGIWPEMWKSYGILGGFFAAVVVIGIMWYMNHWLGVIENRPGTLWIDQGLPIAGAGVAWGVVRFYPNSHWEQIFPTLICCVIGGLLGGWAAHHVKKIAPGWRQSDQDQEAASWSLGSLHTTPRSTYNAALGMPPVLTK